MGHETLFVAQSASINWIAHGLSVIPSGTLSGLFGRRRVFLVSYGGNILGPARLIFVQEPTPPRRNPSRVIAVAAPAHGLTRRVASLPGAC